jgi:SAM-dependent methyltransferase
MNIHTVYDVLFRLFRPRRVRMFFRLFGITENTRILDVGGTHYWWKLAGELGLPVPRVTVVNLTPPPAGLAPCVRWVRADARALPFKAGAFDIAFSNSLIEHLDAPGGRARFAAEIHRIAARWWVQTVDFRFPVEPHYLAPVIHWLPPEVRRRIVRWCTPWGWMERPTQQRCDQVVREIHILHLPELRRLFPGSRILVERFLALPKSIIAICN